MLGTVITDPLRPQQPLMEVRRHRPEPLGSVHRHNFRVNQPQGGQLKISRHLQDGVIDPATNRARRLSSLTIRLSSASISERASWAFLTVVLIGPLPSTAAAE